jgi:SNF2 family DNA or RNA helicase
MLRIDYDPRTHQAILSVGPEVPEWIWAEIRAACERRSPHVSNLGPRNISLPWWSFLLLRPDLTYVLTKHDISLELADMVRSLLTQTRDREAAYREALAEPLRDPNLILEELRKQNFVRYLTPEQLRNVSFLLRFHAAATFSVPGAGKTTEALAYFHLRRKSDTRLLVVAPKNAFAVWEEQISLCSPDYANSVLRLQRGEEGVANSLAQNPTVAIISYQQLYRVVPAVAQYMTENPCFMFLDESHRMKKGYTGAYGSAILSLCHFPVCKLILSGTPVPNSYSDLVPQFTFLYPSVPVSEQNVVEQIRRIYVRTTKPELGLRDPIRILVSVGLGPAQRRLYQSLRSEAARQLEQMPALDRIRLRSFSRSVIRLMQVVTEPALLAESEISGHPLLRSAINEGIGPKIIEACRRARDLAIQGQKCIIWSQFVHIVESVADMLSDLGAEYIHGGVETDEDEENIESREAKIKRFHNDPSCMVLVANPAACAESISLHTICHHAIYIDRSYNAAHYIQSEDRIHRLGLAPNQDTHIYLLHSPDTIDESIKRRLETKVNRMSAVLNDPSLNIEPAEVEEEVGFDQEDLEDLRRTISNRD